MSNNTILIGIGNTPFCELSPYYYCTFKAYTLKWRTLIHYWSGMFFEDEVLRNVIRNQDTPQKALALANSKGLQDFNQLDSQVFLYGIQERFNQNTQLKSIILSTGNCELQFIGNKGYLSYNNRYGKILMKLRNLYQEE